jgi:hypothetical protein
MAFRMATCDKHGKYDLQMLGESMAFKEFQ